MSHHSTTTTPVLSSQPNVSKFHYKYHNTTLAPSYQLCSQLTNYAHDYQLCSWLSKLCQHNWERPIHIIYFSIPQWWIQGGGGGALLIIEFRARARARASPIMQHKRLLYVIFTYTVKIFRQCIRAYREYQLYPKQPVGLYAPPYRISGFTFDRVVDVQLILDSYMSRELAGISQSRIITSLPG